VIIVTFYDKMKLQKISESWQVA